MGIRSNNVHCSYHFLLQMCLDENGGVPNTTIPCCDGGKSVSPDPRQTRALGSAACGILSNVTDPLWDWRHNPDVVEVRDQILPVYKLLLSCLQCAMLTQRQWHQEVPLLTTFTLQNGMFHSFCVFPEAN